MNPCCFACGIGFHHACTGVVRPVSLPAEPCRCEYPLHPLVVTPAAALVPPVSASRQGWLNPGGER